MGDELCRHDDLAAFISSMISMGFILLISGKVKKMSLLIICGIMIGYICSAITDFAVTFADDCDIVYDVAPTGRWAAFPASGWDNVGTMTVVTVFCMVLTILLSKPMDAFRLGEVYAQSMGVNVKLFRVQLILLSSIRVCDGYGVCGSDFLCRHCGAASGKEPISHVKTAVYYSRPRFRAARCCACFVICWRGRCSRRR